ncbi:unnamed protein product [Paramecium sonneborni]|uniref:FCP1 homology domain-containing protein n=1 Tax=Paramecium sonneborni TaxID=65129 RepID=A0A8S1JSS3_9CILI|nr:unnamed protein product [Paramecium sonneborni]
MLIINNESYSYSYQLDNGIPIVPCYDNKYDKELIFLTDYLMNLKQCEQLNIFILDVQQWRGMFKRDVLSS